MDPVLKSSLPFQNEPISGHVYAYAGETVMKMKSLTDKKRRGLQIGMLFILFSASVSAAEFYAIFTNFGDAPHPHARLDISVDTRTADGPVDILYNVFNASGYQIAEFSVMTNENGFASSAMAEPPNRNLFKLTNGEPGLIRARTPTTATTTNGVLYQRGTGSRLAVGVPPTRNSDGTLFNAGRIFPITLGEFTRASLLIANVSGTDINVDVFVGTIGGSGGGKYNNMLLSNKAIWRVDLAPDDANAHIIVSATDAVIVQLMIDDGRVNGITCFPTL
jgi:hypothetical protein